MHLCADADPNRSRSRYLSTRLHKYERVIFLCRVGIAHQLSEWWAMPTRRNQFDTDLRNSVLSSHYLGYGEKELQELPLITSAEKDF